MDSSKILSLLELLDDEIDELEEAISPLLKTTISDSASKLPLLDKAKLFILVTYAIETMLFSYLRLHGVQARGHPVFTELGRVKHYIEKIKAAENSFNEEAGNREKLSLNKGAARRIIAAGLAGNDKHDLQRAEKQANEWTRAHIKFPELSEEMKRNEQSRKRKAAEELQKDNTSEYDSEPVSSMEAVQEAPVPISQRTKRQNVNKNEPLDSSAPISAGSSPSGKAWKKDRKKKGKNKKKANEPNPRLTRIQEDTQNGPAIA